MAQGDRNNQHHPDAHRDARTPTQNSDLEPRVDKLEDDVVKLQAQFKDLGNRVYYLETGIEVAKSEQQDSPKIYPAQDSLEARVTELEKDVHQLQINYKDLGNRVYYLETGTAVQPPQVTQPPPPTGTLDQRVAKLEQDVAQLQLNADNLDERVTALEQAEPEQPPEPEVPPEPEQPPTDTLPPGQEGTENISEGKNLQQLVQAGGEVRLPAGSYLGYCSTQQPTQVIGSNTTLSAHGLTISNGKAMFNAYKPLELSNLQLCDVSVRDRNGAVVRTEPGVSLKMTDCEVHGCQNGILTAGGAKIEVYGCHFYDNGASDGQTHEIYISGSGAATEFVITDSSVICGQKSCHALKVRAAKTTVQRCELKGCTNPSSAVNGTVVDIPEGGEVLIEDTTIESIQGTPMTTIMGYAMENTNHGIKTVTMRNVTITDGRGNGGEIITRRGGNLVLENCKYTTANSPRLTGWTKVTGQFTRA